MQLDSVRTRNRGVEYTTLQYARAVGEMVDALINDDLDNHGGR